VLRPIRDGWVIDREERAAYLAGRFTPVPMIVGSNLDEGGLFVGAWPVKTVADFRELVALNFGASSQQALREYPVDSDADVFRQCAFLFGDTQFIYGGRGIARANSAREPATYRYLFSRRRGDRAESPRHGGGSLRFGRVSAQRAENPPANSRDEALSQQMMDAWVRFAASSDPNGGSLPNWPRYETARDCYFEFGDTLRVGTGWRASQMEFLDLFFDAKSKAVCCARHITVSRKMMRRQRQPCCRIEYRVCCATRDRSRILVPAIAPPCRLPTPEPRQRPAPFVR